MLIAGYIVALFVAFLGGAAIWRVTTPPQGRASATVGVRGTPVVTPSGLTASATPTIGGTPSGDRGSSTPTPTSGQPTPTPVPQSIFTATPIPHGGVISLVSGPDGNLWFAQGGDLIGRLSVSGHLTQFALPSWSYPNTKAPTNIAVGSDGNLWFAEENANQIGRITPSGVITEFALPDNPNSGFTPHSWFPQDIIAGPDGNLWFCDDPGTRTIGRITTAGVITQFFMPYGAGCGNGLLAGDDGNLWMIGGPQFARMTPSGTVTLYSGASYIPSAMTKGPDGALWYVIEVTNKVGRITYQGAVTEWTPPFPGARPLSIVAGPDGNLWMTEYAANAIARVTPAGAITQFSTFIDPAKVRAVYRGPDGNVWFNTFDDPMIGRVTPAGTITRYQLPSGMLSVANFTIGPDGKLWYNATTSQYGGYYVGELTNT